MPRFGVVNYSTCQICNSINHVVIICLKIRDLKPKCDKCNFLHRTKKCGVKCGCCTRMGHIDNRCWKKRNYVKPQSTTNNYLEFFVDNEATRLEQLNWYCGPKHDFFLVPKYQEEGYQWRCKCQRLMKLRTKVWKHDQWMS